MKLNNNRTADKGAVGELLVCADLLGRGFNVYGVLLRVEVKLRTNWPLIYEDEFGDDPNHDVLAHVLGNGQIEYHLHINCPSNAVSAELIISTILSGQKEYNLNGVQLWI